MSAELRKYPRFVDENQVEVEDQEERLELWSADISKGGMFIKVADPLTLSSRLHLRYRPPFAEIFPLTAEVVHVVDEELARRSGLISGVGVEFVDLVPDVRLQLESYIDGLAGCLSIDLEPEGTYNQLDVLLREAKKVSKLLEACDLYGAVGMSAEASREALFVRVRELQQRFVEPPPETPPAKVERLIQVARQLERAEELFIDPDRRLRYDLRSGHLRVDQRKQAGEDLDQIREVWAELFPERMSSGAEHFDRALTLEARGNLRQCTAEIDRALKRDPFNPIYAHAKMLWRLRRRGLSSEGRTPLDVEQVTLELSEIAEKLDTANDFQVLGVGEEANQEAIAHAYFSRSGRYHPELLAGRVGPNALETAHALQIRLDLAFRSLVDHGNSTPE